MVFLTEEIKQGYMLYRFKNVLPYVEFTQTSKACYMVRQQVHASLFDRFRLVDFVV